MLHIPWNFVKKNFFQWKKTFAVLYYLKADLQGVVVMKKIALFEFFKKRSVKIWCAVLVLLFSLGVLLFLIFFVSKSMFDENPRFTLKEVRVESRGFWNGKKDPVCGILRIKPGSTNLFSMDPGEMRKRLLMREPSIEQLQILRILPDTLLIRIQERTPVAQLYNSKPLLFLDSNCILMLAERSMDIGKSLPVISGLRNMNSYPPGGEVKLFSPAADLIVLVNRSYPQIRLIHISVGKEDRLVCVVQYYASRFLVEMPNKNLSRSLRALLTNLEMIRKDKRSERRINLMFKDQAVLSR